MRRAALLLVAVVALAGCGGGPKIPQGKLSSLVLRDRDLPKPFSSFYVGAQTKLDATGSARANPGRFGREGGWFARFHRPGSRETRGPLVVVSRVDLFGSSKGAKEDLRAYGFEFSRQPGVERRRLRPPRIGDATIGTTFVQPGPLRVRFVVVAWRYRNATASVLVQGFGAHVSAADAVRLARRQQQLLKAA
jgi:hypothetical protein